MSICTSRNSVSSSQTLIPCFTDFCSLPNKQIDFVRTMLNENIRNICRSWLHTEYLKRRLLKQFCLFFSWYAGQWKPRNGYYFYIWACVCILLALVVVLVIFSCMDSNKHVHLFSLFPWRWSKNWKLIFDTVLYLYVIYLYVVSKWDTQKKVITLHISSSQISPEWRLILFCFFTCFVWFSFDTSIIKYFNFWGGIRWMSP